MPDGENEAPPEAIAAANDDEAAKKIDAERRATQVMEELLGHLTYLVRASRQAGEESSTYSFLLDETATDLIRRIETVKVALRDDGSNLDNAVRSLDPKKVTDAITSILRNRLISHGGSLPDQMLPQLRASKAIISACESLETAMHDVRQYQQ